MFVARTTIGFLDVETSRRVVLSPRSRTRGPAARAGLKLGDRITNLQAPPSHWTPGKIAGYREEARRIHARLATASPALAARLTARIDAYARPVER